MTTRTPNVFVVGAGPVATALAGALRGGGVPVLGLWARRAEAGRAAAAASGVASFTGPYPQLLARADAVLVAVRDEAISEVAVTLVDSGVVSKTHVLLHCSGAKASSEAFDVVRARVGGIGSLHPLRAIADGKAAGRDLKGTVFGVEGDERGRATALALVGALGGQPLELQATQMPSYHAAAVIASNYLVALLEAAGSVLESLGLSGEDAAAALVPLAQGSLDNVRERGTLAGLTGPIRRGDRATVARHLAVLPTPLKALYQLLGLRTVELARRAGDAKDSDLDEIAALLGGGGECDSGNPES